MAHIQRVLRRNILEWKGETHGPHREKKKKQPLKGKNLRLGLYAHSRIKEQIQCGEGDPCQNTKSRSDLWLNSHQKSIIPLFSLIYDRVHRYQPLWPVLEVGFPIIVGSVKRHVSTEIESSP